jgi:hypothetical protein
MKIKVGFLDFYGDIFDPRTTGISVTNSEYFLRPSHVAGIRSGCLSDLDRRQSFRLAPISHPPLNSSEIGKPFSFDPVFIEDPLSLSNNVGRNSFRINQVQRAFSDASASLTAALEWDMNSGGIGNDLHENSKYPLLKCLVESDTL